MRRLAYALLIVVAALATLVSPAAAGVSWCRADPVVLLNGAEVQVWVAIPEQYESLVTGPVQVTIFTPNNTRTEVTYLDAGFNGHGEQVTFKHRGRAGVGHEFPVDIMVRIPVDMSALRHEFDQKDIPTQLEIITSDGQRLVVDGDHAGVGASLHVRGTE